MRDTNGRRRRIATEFTTGGTVHASPDLAARLRSAGLPWAPRLHDLFMIPDRDLDDRVFALSDMTIDMEHFAGSSTIMFNGAVEWSLDYIVEDQVVWLPTEGQLREALGDCFVSLDRVEGGWRCTTRRLGSESQVEHGSAVDAYAFALLALLEDGFVPVAR